MLQLRDLYPALITCLALLVYAWNFAAAGAARGKHKILAPATTGHPEFERALRIQQNMIEQLIVFIPSLWIFSLSIDVLIGAALGVVFIIGRILYSAAYAKDPAKRGPGFGLSALANIILLIGGLIGVIRLFIIET
jgi:glutathione S-transferase